MSNFNYDDGFYHSNDQYYTQTPVDGYSMDSYSHDQSYGQFTYSQQSSYVNQNIYNPALYSNQVNSTNVPYTSPSVGDNFDDEPPLLEELGINFNHIFQKTLAVLNPMQSPDQEVMQDTDLAGPLVFCLAFGGALLLAGKLHFGYIYGLGVVGCIAMYLLLNMMSLTGVSVVCITSVLGYCLLPMVALSFTAIFFTLRGVVGMILTSVVVLWCSISASNLFVAALAMQGQQVLVAYPCALVYGVFALLTVF